MVMLPIELVQGGDIFLRRARDTINIVKFRTEKQSGISDIEHSLNLDPGQLNKNDVLLLSNIECSHVHLLWRH
jgi:hypothetical protein